MLAPSQIQEWLEQELAGAQVKVTGDDGHHFEAVVVYGGFAGKTLLQQQRQVYAALGDKMQQIHALSIRTLTPEQAND